MGSNINYISFLPLILAVVGWIYSYGRLVQRINGLQSRIKCSDDCLDKFVQKTQFNEYKTVVCKKLDSLQQTIREFDAKNTKVHSELMTAFNKNTQMMGEIKGFLAFYKEKNNG